MPGRAVDVDRHVALVLADDDPGDAGVGEPALDVGTDALVLGEVLLELLLRIPVRFPVVDDAHAKTARMHLLAH
jgi:hypothetical protein